MADSSVLNETLELALPLPNAPHAKIHMRLTISEASVMLLLTTSQGGETSGQANLGSFVYALPDRIHTGQTLCTQLYVYESSIDFAVRLAKLLARKTARPVYVGNSMSFESTGMGGTVEEEMDVLKKVVQVVNSKISKQTEAS